MKIIETIKTRVESTSITYAEVIAGIAAFVLFGEAFLAGALIKSKKVATVGFCLVAAISVGFVYTVQQEVGTELVDSMGGGFLFGSSLVGTSAAMAIGYTLKFAAGFLAGLAWRAPSKSTVSTLLAAASAVVLLAGNTPISNAHLQLTENKGRAEAKMEFYGAITAALRDMRKNNPDVDFKPLNNVLKQQVESVTFTVRAQ